MIGCRRLGALATPLVIACAPGLAVSTSTLAQTAPDSTRADSSARAPAPPLAVRAAFTFYADNTEFFTPYRLGETIIGAQFTTALVARPTDRLELHAGIFGDYRYGSEHLLDQVKPVLSLRYRSGGSTGILGTLETVRRHGFLEPIQVSTLELTRPVEYGVQWIERRRWLSSDLFLNWQRMLRSDEREEFDYGGVVQLRPVAWLALEGQAHGVHRGGQAYLGGEPITNNVVTAYGARASAPLGGARRAELAAFRVRGAGNIDFQAPDSLPTNGHGVYLRAGIRPVERLELFAIRWRARDFLSAEGDRNYSSEGLTYQRFYRSRRRYVELGAAYRVPAGRGAALDAELRLHRMDRERSSSPIIGESWEYSYRLVARLPLDVTWRRIAVSGGGDASGGADLSGASASAARSTSRRGGAAR